MTDSKHSGLKPVNCVSSYIKEKWDSFPLAVKIKINAIETSPVYNIFSVDWSAVTMCCECKEWEIFYSKDFDWHDVETWKHKIKCDTCKNWHPSRVLGRVNRLEDSLASALARIEALESQLGM